jgi:hypothetical protein
MLMRRKKARTKATPRGALVNSATAVLRSQRTPHFPPRSFRRAPQVVDPYELMLLKLPPPPLAASWGRVIKPYMPANGVLHAQRCVLARVLS